MRCKSKEKSKNMQIFTKLVLLILGFFGVTFTIFILNLDMKGAGVAYDWLNKYHDQKDLTRDIKF